MSNDRRSEGDPDRAAFCDRFPRIAGLYGRETIAERCRSGAAAVGEHCSHRLLVITHDKHACGRLKSIGGIQGLFVWRAAPLGVAGRLDPQESWAQP